MPELELYDLICEYQTNPLGLGETRPRLGWKLRTARRGARQVAYRVRAASDAGALTNGGDLLWDSGRVESDASVHVVYQGPAPRSGEGVWWRVQAWDEAGNTAESDSAYWETGLLKRSDWEPARWIAGPLVGGQWTTVPLPYLRREFSLGKPIARARLYVTALGLYECWVNGARAGEDWFTPGWTDYNKRVQYQVYDVTAHLQKGDNVWGAVLGDGWYCGYVSHFGRQVYGDRPKFFAKLVVTFDDGTEQVIVTDDAWRVSYGALLGSDNYNGETYDARLEQAGWAKPGFDAQRWFPGELVPDPAIDLDPNFGAPVRTVQELTPAGEPKEINGRSGTVWIYDFGQEFAGRVRLRVRGERGRYVRLRFGEALNPDGTLYTQNLRSALQTDIYTLSGEGEEVWEPRFTYHGFRYVELSGDAGHPTRETLTGVVMHSKMRPTGTFETSDPMVNQLHHNIVWGCKSNFFDVPTDCPFRDERLGWTGDTQLFMRTAAFNMEVVGFFYKWLRDIVDAQSPHGAIPALAPRPRGFLNDDGGPAWADASVIVPWTLYRLYGDTRILERNYDSMCRYLEYLENTSENFVRPLPERGSQGFGDWMALDAPGYGPGSSWATWQGGTPKPLLGTAFFAHSADLLSRIAGILGRADDASKYQEKFESVRAAFQRNFVSAEGILSGDTQTGYALALMFDLVPRALRERAVNHLVRLVEARDMHLATGFVGTPYLAPALTNGGRADVAYAMAFQRTFPSWLYTVELGATTIWERWDAWTPEGGFQNDAMNSFNHYAFGSIGEWLYETVLGIQAGSEQPGYKHIVLHPKPGGMLTFARGSYESLYGKIVSEWRAQGERFEWRVVIPPNTIATAHIPTISQTVLEGGIDAEQSKGVNYVARADRTIIYRLVPGEYHFEWKQTETTT